MADEDVTAVQEPLIRAPSHENDDNEVQGLKTKSRAGAGAFVYALTFAAGISGVLFGYEYKTIVQKPTNQHH